MSHKDYSQRIQFLVSFAYCGKEFFGVQEQPGLPTVLGALRTRVESSAGQKAKALICAARTDRGVHALQNYATFFVLRPLDIELFVQQVTAPRADGLFAVDLKHVSVHTHARGNSRGKSYCYTIIDDCDQKQLESHRFAWQIVPRLSVPLMMAAAAHLIGYKDFSSLRGGGCQAHSAEKEIFSIRVRRTKSGAIRIDVHGNAFVRKMIRNIAGLLVEIGAGLRKPECVPDILAQKSRNAAGLMAPAHGLTLMKVGFHNFNSAPNS